MYYESKMHTRRPVADANEAARLIHSREAGDCDALVWSAADGRELCAVGDYHCNNTWFETAVIDLTHGVQIESITMGWVDSEGEKAQHLRECETCDFRMGKAALPLDGQGADAMAHFECTHCGEGFNSTIAKQRKYDQDNGYGVCPECSRRYHS